MFTDNFPVPILFRVGAGLPLRLSRDARLILAADAFHPSDNTESVSLGAELAVKSALSVRAGYQNLFQKDSETGLTFGAGVKGSLGESKYHVDYAWADQGRLEATQRFTFGLEF